MPRIRTASRLHFGLISLPEEGAHWPDRAGRMNLPARCFGGVGLMVESPGLTIHVEPAASWSAEGPLAQRALEIAHRLTSAVEAESPGATRPQRIVVESAPREHVGLGTGTQLALAIARVLSEVWGISLSTCELAGRVGRGARSSLGIHGFEQGGFLVEGGKRDSSSSIAPLIARLEFPADWRVVLVLPGRRPGLFGEAERNAFAGLSCTRQMTEALCRLVLLGMLPALAEHDLQIFGEALFDFNARAGEVFAAAQGGTYAGKEVADLIDFIRRQGVTGVGQSSWGPGVFAVTDLERATHLEGRIASLALDGADILVSRGCNHGAMVIDS